MKHFIIFLLLPFSLSAHAQTEWWMDFPKKPDNYVTDQQNILSKQETKLLNEKLRTFEDSTTNQLFIYLATRLRGKNLEDYSKEIFNTWAIGQKDKNNGILIAIFIDDRKYRIQIGYGLEKALPSELTLQIQDEHMQSHFKEKNYYAGIDAGIDQLIYYSKHEYEPPGVLQRLATPLIGTGVVSLLFFVINLLSLKKWSNQPKRKRKYFILNSVFLSIPIISTLLIALFEKIGLKWDPTLILIVLGFIGAFASLLLCTVINDKDDLKYDNETDNAYERRMMRERSREDSSSSSDDSFSGGGGGSSGSGGSSSRW